MSNCVRAHNSIMQEIILDDISQWAIVDCRSKQSSRVDHLLARLHMCMNVSRRRRRVQSDREIIVIITIDPLFFLSLSLVRSLLS